MANLIPRQGTDKRGRPYTRMVKPTKIKIPKTIPPVNNGNKRTNENYANNYLGIESLQTQNRDSLDFHEVSVSSTIAMLNKVAHDSLGRSLSRVELENVIYNNLWEPSDDYDALEVQKLDRYDFHEVSVRAVNFAINEVRLLAN